MMTKADYQVLAVAIREAKRELIARGFIDPIAQEVERIVETNIVEALISDNPAFDRKRFENITDPYSGDRECLRAAVDHVKEVLG